MRTKYIVLGALMSFTSIAVYRHIRKIKKNNDDIEILKDYLLSHPFPSDWENEIVEAETE